MDILLTFASGLCCCVFGTVLIGAGVWFFAIRRGSSDRTELEVASTTPTSTTTPSTSASVATVSTVAAPPRSEVEDDGDARALDGYVEALKARIAENETQGAWCVTTRYFGPPVSQETLDAVEAKLGFNLPPEMVSLYQQANGIQFRAMVGADLDLPVDIEKRPWRDLMGDLRFYQELGPDSEKWRSNKVLVLNVLSLEEVFLKPNFDTQARAWKEDETMRFNRETVNARTFHENLFLFDGFSDYYPCMVHADREARRIQVVLGHDHGATYGDYPPKTLVAYLQDAMERNFHARQFGHAVRPAVNN